MKIVALERNSAGTDIPFDCFKEFGKLVIYPNTVTEQEVIERIADADIIIANKAPLNHITLKDASKVKLICELATGYDNCELAYCKERGIHVANVVNYCSEMVAQHTFTMALALSQKLFHYDNYVKSGTYAAQDRFSNFDVPFYELAGKTWGIIGMGNIGKTVAKIATAFGCKVLFTSVTGKSTVTEYKQVDKMTLLSQCDFVSIHCPLSDITKNYIDEEAVKVMKPNAILINVARGKVVDNEALYKALVENRIAAAGLDVVQDEPLRLSNPLSQFTDSNRLIITPHLAWASVEARTRCVEGVYNNISKFLEGDTAGFVV